MPPWKQRLHASTLSRRHSEPRAGSGNSASDSAEPAPETPPTPYLLALLQKYTLVLENKELVARDHLANERTYLAWVRTALMMMTLALAFLQMYTIQLRAKEVLYENHVLGLLQARHLAALRAVGRPLGVLAGVVSVGVVFLGLFRYFSVQKALCKRQFPASRFIVGGMVVACSAVMVLVLVVDIKTF